MSRNMSTERHTTYVERRTADKARTMAKRHARADKASVRVRFGA